MATKLYHRDATSCSVEGKTYDKGEDGAFEVAEEHVSHLVAHGFVTHPRLASAGPDVKLVEAASVAQIEAEHAKAELAQAITQRDAALDKALALEEQRDGLQKRVAELEGQLAEASRKARK